MFMGFASIELNWTYENKGLLQLMNFMEVKKQKTLLLTLLT